MIEELNHPLLFLVFMLLGLWGMASVATHIFKRVGWQGPAAFFQHP